MSMARQGAKTAVPRLRFPEFRKANSWQNGTIVDFAKVVAGQSPDGANYNEIGEGLPFYQGKSDFGEIFLEKPKKWTSQVTKRAEAGDIVMSVRAPVGSLNVTTEEICIGRGLAAIQARGSKWFLYYILNSISPGIVGNGGSVFDSINKDQIEKLRVFAPEDASEQQKIADCLTSLDEVIAAQGRKVEALKAHKRGLMQQLFPREGETRPRLRFPEFRDAPEWEQAPLRELFDTSSGGTPDRNKKNYWSGKVPWITTSLVNFNVITAADESISEEGLLNSSAKVFPKGTVIVAMYGQGKTRGQVALLQVEAATNQACAAILPNDDIDPHFVFFNLCSRYEELRALSNSGGQENLSQGLIRELPFSYPADSEEQSKIVESLCSIDLQIIAESHRLAALKTHKKGLMQQLFPAPEAG